MLATSATNVSNRTSRFPASRRLLSAVAIVPVVLMLGVSAAPTAQARRVRTSSADFSISISTDAIRVDAGGVATFPVRVRSASRVVPRPVFDVNGLPDYIDAEIERVSTSSYRLNLYVPTSAPSSNGVYELVATARGRARVANFRLQVVGRVVVTQPPVTQPPVTQPPVTQPPVTQPTVPVTVPFNISVDGPERSATTGETVGYPVNVDRSLGLSAPVSFTLTGLPANVQAGFLPNPSSGNTVLYLTPKAGAPSGRSVMTIVATVGTTQRVAAVALTTKTTGDFAMLPTPLSITRTSNGNAVFRLDIASPTTVRPFVTFTAEGAPSGTTLSFNNNNTDAKAVNLTAAVGAATPNGTYNLIVTGRSGAVTKQTSVQLIVNRPVVGSPGFGLAALPTTLNLQRNTSATINLTITPFGNFAGTINTNVLGLPSGVRVVNITNASVAVNQPFVLIITITADAGAALTTAPVPLTITSTSGAIAASVPVNLNVVA